MPSSKTTTSNKAKKSVSKKQSKQVKKELAPAPAPKQQKVVEDTPVVKEVSSENSQTKSTFESRMAELTQEVLGLQTTLKSVYKNIGVLQKEYAKEKKVWERKASSKKSSSGKQQPSGFAKPGFISPELCNFLGVSNGTEMARTDVTKYLTEYIKKNELQDQANRRIILPDKKLKGLLQSKDDDTITYFNLQSYMKIHYNNPNKVVNSA
tara:strand:+ start:2055 stop:2681 length:627 start_codon:yes stop_codon:yes gene_type:complete